MANNDDNSRRDRDRLEDNPFIAFRRFADSQVSSLLNTVFTLPATIANYNNVHQAREACLFKKADNTQCDELHRIEDEIAGLRHDGQELYRAGELQEVLRKSEELMRLDRHADNLRRDIVGQGSSSEEGADQRELVQRVANQKGQEWGWDWSWGFPKPFDDDGRSGQQNAGSYPDPARYREQQLQSLKQVESEAKKIFGEQAWNEATSTMANAMDSNPMFRNMVGQNQWDEFRSFLDGGSQEQARNRESNDSEQWERIGDRAPSSHTSRNDYSPRSLESDPELQRTGVNWREAYEDLVRAEQKERQADSCEWRGRRRAHNSYPKRVPWVDEETNDEPSYEYAHDHEDQHDDPPTPKTKQRSFIAPLEGWNDATQCQRSPDDHDIQKYLQDQQQQGRHLGLRGSEHFARESTEAEPAETELDAYEHLLAKPRMSEVVSPQSFDHTSSGSKPSILSTLTTTERVVAPDGSVTTKVVLKQRFADGREESSETVHTQRGQDMDRLRDHWNINSALHESKPAVANEGEKKPGGWFWSS
jgi:hypothetical protein